MEDHEFTTVIMAGGSGTRFFPLSRKSFPKQYLKLFGENTLIQETVKRISPICPEESIFICSAKSQSALLDKQLSKKIQRILEPEAKNTAPCLMLSTIELLRKGVDPHSAMVVLPADHFIDDESKFRDLIKKAVAFAVESKGLVTLGIFPTHAHTGYGYIEAGDATHTDGFSKVKKFIEKPNRTRAEKFLKQRNFSWNGGIFVWTLHAIAQAFQEFLPDEWEKMNTYQSPEDLAKIYSHLDPAPIDTAILEKSHNVFVIPADIGWNDIGSWSALYDLRTHTAQDNVVMSGETHSVQSRGCLINVRPDQKVALVGVENLILVQSGNVLLIADRNQDQLVREAAKEMDNDTP